MKKLTCIVIIGATLAGCTTVGPQGKEETDTIKSAGAGAAIGAVVGALIGGERGALLGAAIGGGAGYLIALEERKKELEEAKTVASEIERDAGFKSVVAQQTLKNTQTGQTAAGLKEMSFTLRSDEVEDRKGLTDKAALTLTKLSKLSMNHGGRLIVTMPKGASQTVESQVLAAAPNAKISRNGPVGQVVFKVLPNKIEGTGLTVG